MNGASGDSAEDSKATDHEQITHPADDLFYVLERPKFRALLKLWNKCVDRVYTDPEGAITAARSLLEETCHYILKAEGCDRRYGNVVSLYADTTKLIGIHPSKSEDDSAKRVLGALQTLFQTAIDFRRIFGDAHGSTSPAHPSVAQFTVNISSSVTLFLLQSYEVFNLYRSKIDG